MVQKVEVTLIDDLDGGKANEAVSFGLGGTTYEIDLSAENAAAFREALEPYVSAALKVGTQRKKAAAAGRRTAAPAGPDTAEVREWAKAQGLPVSDRGRIASTVVVQFQEAQG